MIAFSFGLRPPKSSSRSSLVYGTEKVKGIWTFLSSELSGFSVVVVVANFFDFLDGEFARFTKRANDIHRMHAILNERFRFSQKLSA